MLIIGVSLIVAGLILHFVLYNYDKARIAHVMISVLSSKFLIGELEDSEYEERKNKVLSNLTSTQALMYTVLYKR